MTQTEPMSTSFSALSDHDWSIITNRWSRGIDWFVEKSGRKWRISGQLGRGFPLFATKTAAYDAASALVLREATHRVWAKLQAEG